MEGNTRIVEAADLMHVSIGFRYTPEPRLYLWEKFKAWLRKIFANTIIHCLVALILSVVIDVLAVYIQATLGLKLPIAASIAFGGASYLAMYYLVSLIKR